MKKITWVGHLDCYLLQFIELPAAKYLNKIKTTITKSCHRQTYQNYEQRPRTSQNLYLQSHFSM